MGREGGGLDVSLPQKLNLSSKCPFPNQWEEEANSWSLLRCLEAKTRAALKQAILFSCISFYQGILCSNTVSLISGKIWHMGNQCVPGTPCLHHKRKKKELMKSCGREVATHLMREAVHFNAHQVIGLSTWHLQQEAPDSWL